MSEYKHALKMSDPKPGPSDPGADGLQFHPVGWNELPVDLSPEAIDGLILTDSERRHTALPAIAATLPRLRWVSMDTDHLVGALDPGILPHLELLVLVGTTHVQVPPGPWPHLRALRADDASISLHAAGLPALEKLEVLARTKRDLAEVAKLPRLPELMIGPVKDDAVLEKLAPLKLDTLTFKRGSIDDLRGLARWPSLVNFGAIACYKIFDLGPLADLPALTDVHFNECSGLTKVDALLRAPKLERARFWGCRDNGVLRKVIKKLKAKGVDVFSELDEDG